MAEDAAASDTIAPGYPHRRYNEVVRKILIPLLALLVMALIALRLILSATPIVSLSSPVAVIGQATAVSVHVRDKHGVRRLVMFVEQNGTRYRVGELAQPSRVPDGTWNFTAGIKTTPQLQDGKAKLIVEATSNDLFRKTASWEGDVTVISQPPTVSADSDQHYLYLGMADLATLNVSGSFTEAGVRVGDQTFRAWPMPGGKPGYFSLFAFAWNMPPSTVPVVYASNGAGNDVTTPLNVQFPKNEQPHYTVHDLQLNDRFIQKVVGELDPNGVGRYGGAFCEDQ